MTLLFTALVAFAVARWFGSPVRQPVKRGSSLHHAQSLDVAGVVAGPILLFLEVPFASAVAADVASAGFHDPELHYQLIPPPGWLRVSQKIIDEKNVGASAMRIVAAFEAKPAGGLQPPMLVISHIDEPGRRAAEINDEMSHDSSLHLGEEGRLLVYDDKRGMVMTTELARSQEGGRFRRLSVFKPAKLGLVHLDFYLADGQLPAYTEPVVIRVLNSWVFAPGFEMRDIAPGESGAVLAEIKQKLRANPLLPAMMTLGLLGMIGGIASKLLSKRKQ